MPTNESDMTRKELRKEYLDLVQTDLQMERQIKAEALFNHHLHALQKIRSARNLIQVQKAELAALLEEAP